jgi:phage/conjugal plasmid C-4 type zinc finger TraR family protein
MADDVDNVIDFSALVVASHKNIQSSRPESLYYCLECGEPIPELRRQAEPGCELCVQCKGWLEKHGSFWP